METFYYSNTELKIKQIIDFYFNWFLPKKHINEKNL